MSSGEGSQRVPALFLGSGEFAIPILAALARHPWVELRGVITAPPMEGRGKEILETPVANWARDHRLPMLRPGRLSAPDAVVSVRRAGPQLLMLADYGQIVPRELLDLPRFGALNLHPSLLPRYRGASPIAAAILGGDSETGVSLILMDSGLDTGPIVAQRRIGLGGDETAPQLEGRLAVEAAQLMGDTLAPWLAGQIKPAPQAPLGATTTRPLRREDGRLDPSRGVLFVERQVRAYQPWPGTFVDTVVGRVLVHNVRVLPAGAMRASGTLLRLPANRLGLALADGLLELLDVQPAGGRPMTGGELLRGRPALAGSQIGDGSETQHAT